MHFLLSNVADSKITTMPSKLLNTAFYYREVLLKYLAPNNHT